MSNKKLQTIKFPGLNDTYTIPQTYTDVGAASASHTHSDYATQSYVDSAISSISIPSAESDAAVSSMLQSLGLNTTTTLIPATTSNLELDRSVVQEEEEL